MTTANEEMSIFISEQIKSLIGDKARIKNNIRINTMALKEINMKLIIYEKIKNLIKVVK